MKVGSLVVVLPCIAKNRLLSPEYSNLKWLPVDDGETVYQVRAIARGVGIRLLNGMLIKSDEGIVLVLEEGIIGTDDTGVGEYCLMYNEVREVLPAFSIEEETKVKEEEFELV